MPKYFMGGTRLEAFERMMMDPSRRPPPPEDPQKTRFRKKLPCNQPAGPAGSRQRTGEDGV